MSDVPTRGNRSKGHYNSTLKRLQQQAAHLAQLLEQERRALDTAHSNQLLLADAILQHKVLEHLIAPMLDQLLQQPAACDSNNDNSSRSSQPWMVTVLQELERTSQGHWARMLQLAVASSPGLGPALKATPVQVQLLSAIKWDNARELTRIVTDKLLLLFELLSPARYPPELVKSADSPPKAVIDPDILDAVAGRSSKQGQSATGAAGLQQLLAPNLEQAAGELLQHLQEFHAISEEHDRVACLMMLHDCHAMISMSQFNLSTGEPCALPGDHYLRAARRLRLTSRQVQHLQLGLRQYNRMARLQNQAGRQVLGMSENSFSLQATVSGALSSSRPTSSAGDSKGSKGAAGPAGDAGSSGDGSAAAGPEQRQQPAEEEEEGACPHTAALEQLLVDHVHNTLDLMKIVSFWVIATLTPWQRSQYLVACWPFFPFVNALVEASAFLVPHDDPPVVINADCCPAAAQAAALAAELGYMDANAYMQRRQALLEDQLQWALQNAQQLLG